MTTHIIAINTKYIHPAVGAYQIQHNATSEVILTECTIHESIDSIIEKIHRVPFTLLAFSVYIWNVNIVKEILLTLATRHRLFPIVLGGPEVSYDAATYLLHYSVDYVIQNEGEESFNELVDFLKGGRFIHQVSNLFYTANNSVHFTHAKLPNLANIKHNFRYVLPNLNRIVYVEASRGCAFHCTYCLASLDKKIRYFPIEQTFNELSTLLSLQVPTIKFLDRSFNVDIKHMLSILNFLKENDNKTTTIQFEVVPDLLTKEIIQFLNNMRPNYIRLEMGIQSLYPKTLSAIKRKQNFDKIVENVQLLHSSVTLHLDLIAGLPFETLSEFKKTFNQTYRLFPNELQLGFLKELKGTYLSNTKESHQLIFTPIAPYEIKQSLYLTEEDIQIIHRVEHALNRYHNKGYFPKTLRFLFLDCECNPFEVYQTLGNALHKQQDHPSSTQLHDLAQTLYLYTKDMVLNSDYLLHLIKIDYLSQANSRPKIWWTKTLTKEDRKQLYEQIASLHPMFSMDLLYRYAHVEAYKNDLFLILYAPNNKQMLHIALQK